MPGSEMPLIAGRSVACGAGVDRHVALDHVAVDQRRVAAHERFGHAVLAMEQGQVMRRLHRDLEAVLPEVIGIALAAAALRVLVQGRLSAALTGDGWRGRDQCSSRSMLSTRIVVAPSVGSISRNPNHTIIPGGPVLQDVAVEHPVAQVVAACDIATAWSNGTAPCRQADMLRIQGS